MTGSSACGSGGSGSLNGSCPTGSMIARRLQICCYGSGSGGKSSVSTLTKGQDR